MDIMVRTICFDIISSGDYEPFQLSEGSDVDALLNRHYDLQEGKLEPSREEFTQGTCVLVNMTETTPQTEIHEGDRVLRLRTMDGG